MKTLTEDQFDQWMIMYGEASRKNDAKASSELFSMNAKYYETPFKEPIVGRDAIYQYWKKGAQAFKDKKSIYEIIALKDNLGIARWQSNFTVIESGKQIALDCIFLAEFDEDLKCCVFREWWHVKELEKY